MENMTDAERIGAMEAQLANAATEAAWLHARVAVLEQANAVLTRQLLDKRGFTAWRVDGRVIVMGRN